MPWSTPQFHSYHPVIRDLPVYPGTRTREQFYKDNAAFWAKAAEEKPTAEAVTGRYFELDTVLEAREAQIEAYNKWAKEQNDKNGYSQKDF